MSAALHDAYAADYDQQVQSCDCHVADVLFGLCYEYVQPGQRLLDAGIGSGLSAQLFAKAGLEIHGFYTRFYQAVATSAANAEYCRRVYGRNLCQHGFADLDHLDHLIQVSGIAAGTRVLDLGCGNGMIAEYIADQTGAQVTGIDFVARAIRDAQARTAAQCDQLAFRVMDMTRLDFPPASFDVVVSIDTLYFTDIYETLRPIVPLLRPGGRLAVFFDQSCGPDKPVEEYPRDLILPDGTELAQALQRLRLAYRTWDYTGPMLAHLRRRRPVLEELKARFEAEGNLFLYESHLGEANGIERAYVHGAGRRYLYLTL
jgi:2-polyprenyl-3-methyl-5-hydroxy-6-metoxy-1,4-benzoquinol methylase